MVREILPVLNVLLHRRTDTVASVAVAVMGDGALPNLFSTRKSKLTTVIMKTTTTMDLPTHPDHHRRRRHRNPPALRRSEGDILPGTVARIESYGAFVSLPTLPPLPGGRARQGLVHISEIQPREEGRVDDVASVLRMNQEVHAVVLECYRDGASGGREKIRLSLAGVDQTTGKLREGYSLPLQGMLVPPTMGRWEGWRWMLLADRPESSCLLEEEVVVVGTGTMIGDKGALQNSAGLLGRSSEDKDAPS